MVAGLAGLWLFVGLVTRSLFWAAPIFGRLHMKSDDNPLREVSMLINRVRLWSRSGRDSHPIPIAVSIGIVAAVGVLTWQGIIGLWAMWTALATFGVAIVVLVLTPLTSFMAEPARPILLTIEDLDRCPADATVDYLETLHNVIRRHDDQDDTDDPQLAPLIVLVLADSQWVRKAFSTVYKDFTTDRDPARELGADFIQKLFDHTVLVPDLAAAQVGSFVDRLVPAPETVIVANADEHPSIARGDAADYVSSEPLVGLPSESVRGETNPLGGDDGQVAENDLAQTATTKDSVEGRVDVTGTPGQGPRDSSLGSALEDSEPNEGGNPPPEVGQNPPDVAAAPESVPDAVTPALHEAQKARPLAVEERRINLMTKYVGIMPTVPRLIRRTINTWLMLEALNLHPRDSDIDIDELRVRAAILFTEFPTLVQLLFGDPRPPRYKNGQWTGNKRLIKLLDRPDVMRLFRLPEGGFVQPRTLAEVLGRHYWDEPTQPEAEADTEAQADEASAPA